MHCLPEVAAAEHAGSRRGGCHGDHPGHGQSPDTLVPILEPQHGRWSLLHLRSWHGYQRSKIVASRSLNQCHCAGQHSGLFKADLCCSQGYLSSCAPGKGRGRLVHTRNGRGWHWSKGTHWIDVFCWKPIKVCNINWIVSWTMHNMHTLNNIVL